MTQPVDDKTALALTMIGEARSEGQDGMLAVGNTVLNRVAKKIWYGLTPKEVCLKPFQYSCWNEKDPNKDFLLNLDAEDKLFEEGYFLASGLLSNMFVDNTNGSTHYYRLGTSIPKWAQGKTPIVVIKNHAFFNNIN